MTLDPDTAHPSLIPSADRKSMRKGGKDQDLPQNPARFDEYHIGLGCEEFTAGRHFWDIDVGSEEAWIVWVAGKTIRRKGAFAFCPEGRVWAMGKWAGSCAILNKPYHPRLALSREPQRI